MRVYINGRFLTRNMTGVERYATELLTALDTILAREGSDDETWTILAPKGVDPASTSFRHIGLQVGGRGGGHAWEQLSLPGLAADGVLLNLANSGPLRHRRSFTVIHDAIVYRMPKLFALRYRSLHQTLGWALSRLSRLGTVSQFSRRELAAVFRIDPSRIAVLPNGSDHLGQVQPDGGILERFSLRRDGFFLFVGSPAPHKNLERTLRAYASLGETDRAFVIVGSSQANVFGKTHEPLPAGAVAAGRLSDAEVAALYANATALVFPSLYEGFGIPPLEAMTYGAPVLAADVPPIREVCGSAATYFDPLSEPEMAAAMRAASGTGRDAAFPEAEARERLRSFQWQDTARKLREAVRGIV